jgi:Flp pilus assembly protein CpaB
MRKKSTPPPETTPGWAAGFRRRIPFYIILAVVLAAFAGILTFLFLDRLQQNALPTTRAIVAQRNLGPGTELTAEMVETRPVPEGLLPEGHLTDAAQVIGRELNEPVMENEVILQSDFSGARGSGLSAILPQGNWAIVLPAEWLVSPIPEVITGDHLDLLAYLPGQTVEEAGVIVSSMEILDITGTGNYADRLTLAVSIEEAVAILYTRANGFSLLLLLRPEGGS